MIQTRAWVEDADRFTITVRFTCIADPGEEVKRVSVTDRFGMELPTPQPENCRAIFEFVLERVNRERLPLFIECTNCDDVVTSREHTGPVFDPAGPPAGGPGISLPCSAVSCDEISSRCREDIAHLESARSRIVRLCEECHRFRALMDADNNRAIAGFIIFAALAAAAIAAAFIPFVGQLVAFALATAAIVALGFAVSFLKRAAEHRRRLESCEDQLRQSRDTFDTAVARVRASCCPGCIRTDLSQPTC